MKNLILIIIICLLFTACDLSLKLLNEDGFSLYNLGGWLSNEYIIQSHDGFMIDDHIYIETVKQAPFVIENIQNRDIQVKITTEDNSYWETILANDSLLIEE